jgi:hypothetical protein
MKKPSFKEPEVDLSFKSSPLTKTEALEISAFIAKRKKQLEKNQTFNRI